MAKKTIKAQMKQRRDTKANWAATNPVLLDGELGIVSDDPNLYKVGDGATAWNSLPFRGFDGTLAQELGTSPNAVISQKVVSEKLTELESQVDNLNFDIKSETILGTDTGTWGYSWGFQCDDEYDDLQFLPEFTEPIPYTLDVYQVDGEVGQTGTKYTLINTSSLRAGEACHVANTNKHTLVIVTSSDGTLIKYTEVKPSVCAFELVYRKDEKFGKVNNSYISGTIICKTKKDKEIYIKKEEIIKGNDTGTWGYSWGFVADKKYKSLQYVPDFTEPVEYTLDVYQVIGEVGGSGTTYNLIETKSLSAGEVCTINDIDDNTLVITTSSDGTLIKYTDVKPSVCAFGLVYRKDGVFGLTSNKYASGTFVIEESISSKITAIENDISEIKEEITQVQSPLFGKNVYLIGDSITEENNGRAETNWVGFLRENCKCNITNKGVSGTGFSTAPRQKYARRIPEVGTDVDIFGITISFNDLDMTLDGIEDQTYKREVGTYMDTSESTICGFINVFFDTLFERFPSVPVITYIQNPWAEGGTQPHHPAYRYGQTKSDDFVAKVTETIRRRGVPVYADMYLNGSVLKPWIEGNKNVYFVGTNGVSDTDHPGTEGHKVIYKYLREKFEQNVA